MPGAEPPSTAQLVFHRSAQAVFEEVTGPRWNQLAPETGAASFVRLTIPPKTLTDHDRICHPALDCLYITSGTLGIGIGAEEYALQVGDSISFRADMPHRIWNNSDAAASALRFTVDL